MFGHYIGIFIVRAGSDALELSRAIWRGHNSISRQKLSSRLSLKLNYFVYKCTISKNPIILIIVMSESESCKVVMMTVFECTLDLCIVCVSTKNSEHRRETVIHRRSDISPS